jgi:hypothetical protein
LVAMEKATINTLDRILNDSAAPPSIMDNYRAFFSQTYVKQDRKIVKKKKQKRKKKSEKTEFTETKALVAMEKAPINTLDRILNDSAAPPSMWINRAFFSQTYVERKRRKKDIWTDRKKK